jgi:[ribosomal protein S18]-alanine N-acetyltransferase
VKIRTATAKDIPSIINLERACPTAAHWSETQYGQLFVGSGAERVVFVAARGVSQSSAETEAPAEAALEAFLVAQHVAPDWELENIVVAPNSRRKGLGKRLLDALLDHARETNSDAVFLEARASNAAACALYEKAGFRRVGSRKSYYSNPLEDAILYRREVELKKFSE